jgi:hypothetical protein
MAYSRTYPIADNRSYRPGSNPLLAQKATVTTGSTAITNIRTDYITEIGTAPWVASDWFVTIKSSPGSLDVGSYRIAGTGANSITVTNMDGSGWTASATGDCNIVIFNKNVPSAWDRTPEAILVTTAGTGPFTGITSDGQYFEIQPSSFVASAIYSINVREIISTGGLTGYLLGIAGMNGSPLY